MTDKPQQKPEQKPTGALGEIEVKALPEDKPGKRLFIGARISVAAANALVGCAETLARRTKDAGIDVRWVPSASYHVTLKFLGWTRTTAIPAVCDALERAASVDVADERTLARLAFKTARLGAFPSLDKANVVWAGVDEPTGALTTLANRIDAAMTALGFAAEKQPFHAHVTLGRLRESRPLEKVVLPLAEQMFGESRLDAIVLFESETKSSGSVYKEISRISLKSSAETAERQTRAVDLGASKPSNDPRADIDETDDGWPRGQGPT